MKSTDFIRGVILLNGMFHFQCHRLCGKFKKKNWYIICLVGDHDEKLYAKRISYHVGHFRQRNHAHDFMIYNTLKARFGLDSDADNRLPDDFKVRRYSGGIYDIKVPEGCDPGVISRGAMNEYQKSAPQPEHIAVTLQG